VANGWVSTSRLDSVAAGVVEYRTLL